MWFNRVDEIFTKGKQMFKEQKTIIGMRHRHNGNKKKENKESKIGDCEF